MAAGIGPQRIAVIVPCHDEAPAVGGVVDALHAALPCAVVHVYDNASTDGTADVAALHGAVVRREPAPGKGNAVRRAFADVDADVYVLIDGDGTYDASAVGQLVDVLLSGPHDVVVGARRPDTATAHRRGHAAGNRWLNRGTAAVFGTPVTDMLSGYRVMSRRFVKSFPALSRGFEVEAELTVHAAHLRVPQVEVPVGFTDRPEGSRSKLRTVRDGARIVGALARMAHGQRPVAVHAVLAAALLVLALVLASPAVGLLAALVAGLGLVLGAVQRGRSEASRRAYLAVAAPGVAAVEHLDAADGSDPDGPSDLTDLVQLVEGGSRTPRPRAPSDVR